MFFTLTEKVNHWFWLLFETKFVTKNLKISQLGHTGLKKCANCPSLSLSFFLSLSIVLSDDPAGRLEIGISDSGPFALFTLRFLTIKIVFFSLKMPKKQERKRVTKVLETCSGFTTSFFEKWANPGLFLLIFVFFSFQFQ